MRYYRTVNGILVIKTREIVNNRKIFWLQNGAEVSLPSKKDNAALVKGLRRLPFTEESRVRFPYVVQSPPEMVGFFVGYVVDVV